jgi:hypothetical protein
LDIPENECLACEQEEETEGKEMQLLLARPSQKDAIMAQSMLDTVISASAAIEKIVKTVDGIQHFVSKINRQSLKQRYIDP